MADETGVMDIDEAHAALRSQQLGRLAWIKDGRPEVLPVTYALIDGSIVLRSGMGGKEEAANQQVDAAFEVDGVDPEAGTAWSVVVHGRLEDVADGDEIDRLEEQLPPPHVQGRRNHVLRLNPRAVRGRELQLTEAWRADG